MRLHATDLIDLPAVELKARLCLIKGLQLRILQGDDLGIQERDLARALRIQVHHLRAHGLMLHVLMILIIQPLRIIICKLQLLTAACVPLQRL